jgi:molybdopterin-guanine dinucleotide biosynthesis protein A
VRRRDLLVTNRPDLYEFLQITIVEDVVPNRGPLGGLQAAHRKLGATRALVVASDYPFLEEEALRRILREDPKGASSFRTWTAGRIRSARCTRRTPSPPVNGALERGELMVMSLVGRLTQTVVPQAELGGAEASRIFFNVNTPSDIERAEEILAATEPRRR